MKSIVVVSDLHVGSHFGLCDKNGVSLGGGMTLTPSKFQGYVWDCWMDFWNKFVPENTKGTKDISVIVNGDMVEGNHHGAVDLIPKVSTQEDVACEILRPVLKKYSTYFVRGTEAHGSPGEQSTDRIARALDGVKDPDTGDSAWWQVWLSYGNTIVQAAHHIGTTSSAAYETSAPMRELVASLIESAQWGQHLPDICVRSHRHRFTKVMIPREDDKEFALVVTPAWQLRTPYVEKIDRMRLPHIGGIVINLQENKKWTINHKIYPMPKPNIQTL